MGLGQDAWFLFAAYSENLCFTRLPFNRQVLMWLGTDKNRDGLKKDNEVIKIRIGV